MNSRLRCLLWYALLASGCSHPWIEVVVAPNNFVIGSRASRCLIEGDKCADVGGQRLEHCVRVHNPDPDGMEIFLYGNHGIMCAEEERALKQCPAQAEECVRKTGATVNFLDSHRAPTKAVEFDEVATTGRYLVLFSEGFNIPLRAVDDTELTFARRVVSVSSERPSKFKDNRVTLPDLKGAPLAAPLDMSVILDDGSQCHFILQPDWMGPLNTREYTFDCHVDSLPSARSSIGSREPRPLIKLPLDLSPDLSSYKDVRVRGLYTTMFEVSAFRPCGSSEIWFLRAEGPSVAQALSTVMARSSCKAPNCSFAFEIEGALSPRGQYGHLGSYSREVLVERIMVPSDPDDHRHCSMPTP